MISTTYGCLWEDSIEWHGKWWEEATFRTNLGELQYFIYLQVSEGSFWKDSSAKTISAKLTQNTSV